MSEDEWTERERAYAQAMADAVMPGILDTVIEQMRRFQKAAMPFVRDEGDDKEPSWMGAADIASTRFDMLRSEAKKQLWRELEATYGSGVTR